MYYVSIKLDIYQENHPIEGEQEVTEITYTLTDIKPETSFIFVGELSHCLEFLDFRGVDILDIPTSFPSTYSTRFTAHLN